jgi:hypothetical protein
MSEWQPIETAPKDGTEILAWEDEYIPYVCTYWRGGVTSLGHNLMESWQLVNIFGSIENNRDIEPTHWMELPKPPKKMHE